VQSYKPGKPIEEVKRALKLKDVYKLASNEIPFYPDYIKAAIAKELKNINRYPEASCFYLRQALAKKLKVSEDNIVFGNGSDELITLALRAFVSEQDEIIVANPTFLIYEIQARIQGAKVKKVILKELSYDLEAMAKAVTKKTKIIFIANPDNPTGSYSCSKAVKSFLNSIPKNVLVFFDEAYFEFAPKDFPDSLDILKSRGNVIVTRTFSKAYGLAGLRVGYGVTSKEIACVLNKVREPFNVNRFAQVAAIEALKSRGFLNKVISFTKREKEYFYKEFTKLGLPFNKSATNFVLVKFKGADKLYNYLLKRGVIIRELSGWGLRDYFRVTVGKQKENHKFISCLRSYLNGY